MQHQSVILVVDDEPHIRDILDEILTEKGFRVLQAGNGKEALVQLYKLQITEGILPSLILSDIKMPVMDGFQLADRLEKIGLPQNIPLVLMSSQARPCPSKEQQIKFAAFITKPFKIEMVISLIRKLVVLGS